VAVIRRKRGSWETTRELWDCAYPTFAAAENVVRDVCDITDVILICGTGPLTADAVRAFGLKYGEVKKQT
jgi:hypothetical protein